MSPYKLNGCCSNSRFAKIVTTTVCLSVTKHSSGTKTGKCVVTVGTPTGKFVCFECGLVHPATLSIGSPCTVSIRSYTFTCSVDT